MGKMTGPILPRPDMIKRLRNQFDYLVWLEAIGDQRPRRNEIAHLRTPPNQ